MTPPPSTTDKPPSAAAENPSWWRFTWEAQSHTSILRLLLFNPNTKPSAQCRDLKLTLLPQQSLLTVSFLEGESLTDTSIRVPVPRVLVDPESPIHFKVFDDHIEAKLVLLLPVDHPLISGFDSILCADEIGDELRPFSLDYDIKELSRMEEVHFYCRNCMREREKAEMKEREKVLGELHRKLGSEVEKVESRGMRRKKMKMRFSIYRTKKGFNNCGFAYTCIPNLILALNINTCITYVEYVGPLPVATRATSSLNLATSAFFTGKYTP